MRPAKTSSVGISDELSALEGTGNTTPHSQLRQLILGSFRLLSLTIFPQALSDRLALPTYAQAMGFESFIPRAKRILVALSASVQLNARTSQGHSTLLWLSRPARWDL